MARAKKKEKKGASILTVIRILLCVTHYSIFGWCNQHPRGPPITRFGLTLYVSVILPLGLRDY